MTKESLRDRLREQTASEIERAAMRLFAEHGYEATTTEQIAGEAGVSARTFFRYFPTKESVLFRDHAEKVRKFRRALEAGRPDDPPVQRITAAMIAVQRPDESSEIARARAELMTRIPELRSHHASLVEAYESVIADALAPPGSPFEQRVRAHALAGAVFGVLRSLGRITPADQMDEQALFRMAMAVLEPIDEAARNR
jgi:AcrR family transcriptional regulator